MKEKIIIFAVGLLVGSVITSGAFFVYTKATVCKNNNQPQTMQMPGGGQRNMPNDQNGKNEQGVQPPNNGTSQNGDNTQNNNSQNSSS